MKRSFTAPVVFAATLTFILTVTSVTVSSSPEEAVVVVSDSPWGVAPSTALSHVPQSWAPAMVEAGVTTVRGFAHSSEGDNLSALTDAGLTATGFLWWSSGPVQSLPVNDLNGWRAYVTARVTKYKGRIRHWEVWNEPPNFTDNKTPQAYAQVVAAAYDAAKAADPTVQIGLAAKSNHVNFLAQSIDAGAADKFDFITLHPYENAELVQDGGEAQFMSIAPRVRKMLLDKNPAKVNAPIWFTEVGRQALPADPNGTAQQADALVKIYIMSIAQGVARVHWFDPRDSEGLNFGLTAADGTKRPAYFAMKTLSTRLGKRPTYLGWLSPGGAYYGFVFSTPEATVFSVWTPPGRSAVIPLLSAVSLVDPRSGNVVSTSSVTATAKPILLIAPTNSEQAQQWRRDAAANRIRGLPWNGDHTASRSVSLTAGRQPDGIFARGMPAPNIVGGISEFNLTGRTGQTFTVDPTFMSYTTSAIKITVVLRGHGTGDPGFNLKYESNAPLASADSNGLTSADDGWHRVVGTTFYEKSWTISNPRFVGLYGYNFTLDSDGPAHSQYSIHTVIVSKL